MMEPPGARSKTWPERWSSSETAGGVKRVGFCWEVLAGVEGLSPYHQDLVHEVVSLFQPGDELSRHRRPNGSGTEHGVALGRSGRHRSGGA